MKLRCRRCGRSAIYHGFDMTKMDVITLLWIFIGAACVIET